MPSRPGVRLLSLLFLSAVATRGAAPPDRANVAYGDDARNRFDFWKPAAVPRAGARAPVILYLHGGGYRAGDKSAVQRSGIVEAALPAGVAVASANYRFRPTPIQDILRDCGRALQHLRAHADAFGIDPDRIAIYGGSAGATAGLWLAFHDDLAEPGAADPVRRASSKPAGVVAVDCQFSLDIPAWDEVFGPATRLLDREANTAAPFYGMPDAELRGTPRGQAVRRDCHLPAWIGRGDPPVFLTTRTAGGPPRDYNQLVHHPEHVRRLAEACRATGVRVVADAPGASLRPGPGEPGDPQRFLREILFPR